MNTLLHVLTNHQKHAPIEVDEVACLNRGQTTADYLELGHRFARAFAERGVGPGDRVLIATPTSPQLLGAIFGAWLLQAAVVLVPYEIKRRRKEQSIEKLVGILRDSQPAACLAGGAVAAILVEHGLPVRNMEACLLIKVLSIDGGGIRGLVPALSSDTARAPTEVV